MPIMSKKRTQISIPVPQLWPKRNGVSIQHYKSYTHAEYQLILHGFCGVIYQIVPPHPKMAKKRTQILYHTKLFLSGQICNHVQGYYSYAHKISFKYIKFLWCYLWKRGFLDTPTNIIPQILCFLLVLKIRRNMFYILEPVYLHVIYGT